MKKRYDTGGPSAIELGLLAALIVLAATTITNVAAKENNAAIARIH